MSSKRSSGKLEVDVQRFRDEGSWKKIIEIAEQQSGKVGVDEQLTTFLLGEAKLEQYLEENPPYEHNASKAKLGLMEAKQLLTLSAGKDRTRATGSMDAQLLLAKLHFACGEYQEVLQYLSEAGLSHVTERPLPSRSLRIVAESFAIQALSLEKLATPSKPAEQDQRLVKSLELAGEITLLYFQEQDKLHGQSTWSIATTGSNSPLPPTNEQRVGLLLETALLRAPLIHIKAGRWSEAINRYRTIMRIVESSATQTLRLTFARQLAEILIRRMCQANYIPYDKKTPDCQWKSKYYTGSGLFTPRDLNEEIFLLLLIGEGIAVRDVVLSQSPEFRDMRKTTLRNASAIYDLLTICCIQHDQASMLSESLERALKFSFEDAHIWSQFAYSLIASGKYSKAVLVLKEVARLSPNDSLPCLMAARVCLERLNLVDDGYDWASQAVTRLNSTRSNISARCYLFKGLACFIKWRHSKIPPMKQSWMEQCMEALGHAVEHDPNDHLVHFYLALTHALCRQVNQALAEVQTALRSRSEHLPSLILLALLLSTSAASPAVETECSSSEEHHGSLLLIEATLEEYPHNFDLLYVKALLEEQFHGGETALVTAKEMLALWKHLYEDTSPGDTNASGINKNNLDARSLALSGAGSAHPLSNDMADRESSIYAQSVAAARAEQALSDVTSSMSSNLPRPGPSRAWHVQLKIWLLTGELYVRLGKCEEALACAQEAATLSPVSHHVMFLRGLIHETKNEFAEAKTFFKNATALSPFHGSSLQHLGIVFHHLGSHRLAEKTLRDAVRLDPTAENSWYNLGKVLEAMEEYEAASDCMATALQVQISSPIVPFSAVPLCFE